MEFRAFIGEGIYFRVTGIIYGGASERSMVVVKEEEEDWCTGSGHS